MAFLLVNSGATAQALVKLGKNAFSQWLIGLYTNNYTPQYTDTISNYTSGAGTIYAADLAVDQTSWAGTVSAGIWTGTANPLVFTLLSGNGGTVIFGYYLKDSNGLLHGAELYTAPYTMPNTAGVWSVALQDIFKGQ